MAEKEPNPYESTVLPDDGIDDDAEAADLERVCSRFEVGSSGLKDYRGAVLIDDANIYMLVRVNMNVAFAGIAGGLFGTLAAAFARAVGWSLSLPFETTLRELPDEIRAHSAWVRVSDQARVIVLPKSAVKSISCSIFFGCIIRTESAKFRLRISMFGAHRVKALLKRRRWLS